MKVGDPKKAAILGLAALGAVGFLGSTLLQSGGSALPALIAAVTGQAVPDPGVTDYPSRLLRDPFSHFGLIQAADNPAGEAVREIRREVGASDTPRPLPGGSLELSPLPVPGPSSPPPFGLQGETSPVKETGNDRQQERGDPALVVTAIVEAERPIALIAVGEGESQPRRVGDAVGSWKVVAIEADMVILRRPEGERRLRVGERMP